MTRTCTVHEAAGSFERQLPALRAAGRSSS